MCNELARVLATDTESSVAGVLGARVDGAALTLRSLKVMYFKLSKQIHPDKGGRVDPDRAKMAMQVQYSGLMGLIAWRLTC